MKVLVVLHVLADHEEVIAPVVHGHEVLHLLARAGVEDLETQPGRLTGADHGGFGRELQFVVTNVIRVRLDQHHAVAGTRAADIGRVVRMDRADVGDFLIGIQDGWSHRNGRSHLNLGDWRGALSYDRDRCHRDHEQGQNDPGREFGVHSSRSTLPVRAGRVALVGARPLTRQLIAAGPPCTGPRVAPCRYRSSR